MDKQELKNILDKHLKWIRGENGGKRADLSRANLSGANLSRANLFGADYIEKAKNLFYPIACPEIGAFVGWKKARTKTSGHECIVKLEITEDAVRSSAAGRECRCSKATVLEIQDLEIRTSITFPELWSPFRISTKTAGTSAARASISISPAKKR